MKTTLNIHDTLLFEAKAFAAQRRTTLTKLIEEGLRMRLQPELVAPRTRLGAISLPTLPSKKGRGLQPGINPLSNRSLYEAADGLSS
jgi:hypothetical protein